MQMNTDKIMIMHLVSMTPIALLANERYISIGVKCKQYIIASVP